MLGDGYCIEQQKNQSCKFFKAETTVPIDGTGTKVRANPNMWHILQSNARKAFKNLSKYENIWNDEPNGKWKSTLHRGMSGGIVSMSQIQHILSFNEWSTQK